MQTFLIDENLQDNFTLLDYRRLGKQRLEAKVLINDKGWLNHPARLMWEGYKKALKLYYNTCVKEWISRGYKNTMELFPLEGVEIIFPPWYEDKEILRQIILTHKSNLIRKNPTLYAPLFPGIPADIPYLWPVTRYNK